MHNDFDEHGLVYWRELGTDASPARDGLIAALTDDQAVVRAAAHNAIEKIAPNGYPYFQVMLGKGTAEAKLAAMKSLGKLGAEAAVFIPLLLKYNEKPALWGGGKRGHESLFPVVAAIDLKDPRFAEAVIAFVSAPNPSNEVLIQDRRIAGLNHLGMIEATKEVKVAALVEALNDRDTVVLKVIAMLQDFGSDAAAALPQLKTLKESGSDAVKSAAITAIANIE